MRILRSAIALVLLLSGVITAGITLAAKDKGPGGPPPEILACHGKKAGDACTFKNRDGIAKSDTCRNVKTPKGNELSCGDLPKPPRDGGNDMPPEGDFKE